MKKSFFVTLSCLISFAFSRGAQAGDLQKTFDALKNLAVDYRTEGQICEQVARLQFAETYNPEKYEITGGIEYSLENRTLGDLDLLIVDRETRDVVVVGEVKCWKSYDVALDKAHYQTSRLMNALQTHGPEVVFAGKNGESFHADQFKNPQFISVAQLGSRKKGFDVELGFTLPELLQLRSMLMACQAKGPCPRPY